MCLCFFPAHLFYFVLFILLAVGAFFVCFFFKEKHFPPDVSFPVILFFSFTYIPTAANLKQGSDT